MSLAAYDLTTAPVLMAVSLPSPPFSNVAGEPQTGYMSCVTSCLPFTPAGAHCQANPETQVKC